MTSLISFQSTSGLCFFRCMLKRPSVVNWVTNLFTGENFFIFEDMILYFIDMVNFYITLFTKGFRVNSSLIRFCVK